MARARGRCELCGEESQDLRLLILADFFGMACENCRRQLEGCRQRVHCGTGEETEPGE